MKQLLAGIFLIGALLPLRAQITETKLPQYIMNEPSGALDFKKQPFDVLNYTVQLDLSKAPLKLMSGICVPAIKWTEAPAGKKFFFHLRSLKVDSVLYKGMKLLAVPVGEPLSADFHYEIDAPADAVEDEITLMVIHYSGEMTAEYPLSVQDPKNAWGGVQSNSGYLYAMGVGFKNDYVSATRHWMPSGIAFGSTSIAQR